MGKASFLHSKKTFSGRKLKLGISSPPSASVDLHFESSLMDSNQNRSGGAFFPEDLVFAILSWLPALSLIRFKCVKKSWRDVIKNPNFAAKHLGNQSLSSSSDGDFLLLMRRFSTNSRNYETRISLVFFADDGNDTSTVARFIDFPVYTGDGWLSVSGYCHGIICFSAPDGYVALANPGIRQFRALPDTCIPFRSTKQKSNFNCFTGFGYDSVSGAYKVVRAWILDDDGDGVNNRVEVYTLSTDSWREINNFEPFIKLLNWSHGPSKYLNGAYYWWIEVEEEDDDDEENEAMVIRSSVIVFDMSKEVFLLMHWPHPFYNFPTDEELVRKLLVMDGSLVLVTCYLGILRSVDIQVISRTDDGGIGVTKLDTIGPLNGVNDVLVFWKDNEILFRSWDDRTRIVSYKKGARETKLLPALLSYDSLWPIDVEAEVYASSLISIT